jgi:hypothetical protein
LFDEIAVTALSSPPEPAGVGVATMLHVEPF